MNEPDIVAWSGPVQLAEARWTDREGTTVRFKLLKVDEERRNPFMQFTKRRKDRAGTRFNATIVSVKDPELVVYCNEVMLAGWNDSQTQGMSVTMWLAEDKMGHPFEGFDRKSEFMVVLVELDEDETPINQKTRAKVEAASVKPSERLSYRAAMLCKNPDFWAWASSEESMDPITDETEARDWMLDVLEIDSRAQLDKDPAKAHIFRERIGKAFTEWSEKH